MQSKKVLSRFAVSLEKLATTYVCDDKMGNKIYKICEGIYSRQKNEWIKIAE